MALTVAEIDDRITKAGRLDRRIIAVSAQETAPQDAVTVREALRERHPCVARALHSMSVQADFPAVYVAEGGKGCCGGAQLWFGFRDFPSDLSDMFSSDSPDPGSMRLKASSGLCRRTLEDVGRFVPLGRYIVMRPLSAIEDLGTVRSILCFGTAGQMRDLAGMVHFVSSKAYQPITAPWGSGCATFVSYPSGMAVRAPRDTAFISPTNPEADDWLPADTLAMGIPAEVAVRMAEGYEASFASRR